MVKPKQLGHIVLRVRDIERSEQFYSDVLGLHVTNKRPGRMTFMSAVEESSHELALVPVGDDAPGPEDSRESACTTSPGRWTRSTTSRGCTPR